MRRILFVDHTPFVGGAQLVLASHIRHLDRGRFTPVVACTDDVPFLVERYREVGAEVHVVPIGRLRQLSPAVGVRLLRAARELRKLLRREAIDLVVANTSRAAYVCSLSVLGTGVPLVWWVRDFLFWRPLFRLMRPIPRAVVCVSSAIRSFYTRDADPRITVVYVGSDLATRLDEVSEADVAAERARWGLGPDDLVVGFMGRLVDAKGPEDVLEGVVRLQEEFPRVKLVLVGTGGRQEGDVEAKLQAEVARRRLSGVILTGHQSNEPLYYRLFDVYVLGTRTDEPYATSVVQAMMAGTPVVATATGGTPELVRHRETGLLVPPRRPDAIAEALRTLIVDPRLRRKVADGGRDHVLRHNTEEVTTAQVEELYEWVLAGGGTSAQRE